MLNKWPNGARNTLYRERYAKFRSYVNNTRWTHSVGCMHWRTDSRKKSRKRLNWLIRGWCWWLKTLFVICTSHWPLAKTEHSLYLSHPRLFCWSSHCDTDNRVKLFISSKSRMTKYRTMKLAEYRLIIDGFCIQSTRWAHENAIPLSPTAAFKCK